MKEFEKQISFFDGSKPFKIDKPIRLIELFAGIGAQAAALERLQGEGLCTFEHYRICEFDKYAVKSYRKIYYVPKNNDAIVEAEICGKCVDKHDDLYFIVYSEKPELDFEAIKMSGHIYFNREDAEKHLQELAKNDN